MHITTFVAHCFSWTKVWLAWKGVCWSSTGIFQLCKLSTPSICTVRNVPLTNSMVSVFRLSFHRVEVFSGDVVGALLWIWCINYTVHHLDWVAERSRIEKEIFADNKKATIHGWLVLHPFFNNICGTQVMFGTPQVGFHCTFAFHILFTFFKFKQVKNMWNDWPALYKVFRLIPFSMKHW